jgi:hypothetical protein
MSPNGTAFDFCTVDIYPFEGGPYSFSGAAVLEVITNKRLKEDVGSFKIVLAPTVFGNGLSAAQILTPMSLVVIGMQRADKSAVTMLGFISLVEEGQVWQPEKSVVRTITITGPDIAYYFMMEDYYTLWVLTATGALLQGGNAAGLLSGEPDVMGKTWYDTIMTEGVFKDTSISYKKAKVAFKNLYATRFDKFKVYVPYSDYFLGINGAWMAKYRAIFPFPFYEFFVTTTAPNTFSALSGGTAFATVGLGASVTATPAVIARLNPLPQLVTSIKSSLPSFDSIDTSAWQKLPNFDLEGVGFISSHISFSESEVYNFYTINPTWLMGQNGDSNSNLRQYIFNYEAGIDWASVTRYGYRPWMQTISWFADITGQIAQQTGKNATLPEVMATVLGQLCGYYEAMPLMAKADVSTWLRPDIEIGTRFSYAPYRDGVLWDFYIEGVTNHYVFGGPSMTHLTLTRGLPSAIYNDSSTTGVLFNMHIGNAQRIGGEYKVGLPSGSGDFLKALPSNKFAEQMITLDNLYLTAQGTQSPPTP